MGAKNSRPGLLRGIVSDTRTPARSVSPCWSYPVPWLQGHLSPCPPPLRPHRGTSCTQLFKKFRSPGFWMAGGAFCTKNPTLKTRRLAGTTGACLPVRTRLGVGAWPFGVCGLLANGVVRGVAGGGAGVRRWLQLPASLTRKRFPLDPGEPRCSPAPGLGGRGSHQTRPAHITLGRLAGVFSLCPPGGGRYRIRLFSLRRQSLQFF